MMIINSTRNPKIVAAALNLYAELRPDYADAMREAVERYERLFGPNCNTVEMITRTINTGMTIGVWTNPDNIAKLEG